MNGWLQGLSMSSSLMSAMIQGQLYSDWLSNWLDAQSPREWMNYQTLPRTQAGNVPQTQTQVSRLPVTWEGGTPCLT
ncbi:unnamed protein product [Arctogadus glacialis]